MLMTNRWVLPLAVLFSCLCGSSLAADVSVAVVDVVRLQSEAPQVGQVRGRIKQDFAARESKVAEQAAQIAQLEEKLVQDRLIISDVEAKSLQRDIRSRTLRLENAREELDSDRRLRLSEEMDHLRRVLSEVIAEVATAEELDLVLESGVTWVSERANITDKVLARMRELNDAEE